VLTAIAEIMPMGIWHFCLATIPDEVSTSRSLSSEKVVLPNNCGVSTPPKDTITLFPDTSFPEKSSPSMIPPRALATIAMRRTMF
jgi:hypothetical protein